MCGIAGFALTNPVNSPTALLKHMSDVISHRGPDDEGFFSTTTNSEQCTIGLAHRRLSIIDLSGGHQPMANPANTTQIVFNGEIYNYRELRKELENKGHTFSSSSDTESILVAYDEYGADCIKKLQGMFAFALWDSKKQQLLLARDHFGKKPLYYWQQGDQLVFSSEIKSLLIHSQIRQKVNRRAIWNYLTFRYIPGPDTLFDGIHKLPPASYGIWKNGQLTISRYYYPPDRDTQTTVLPYGDVIDEFTRQLDAAVEKRMVCDVPFGAFLSGGLDSSAVVGLMSKHSSTPIKTFSVGFSETQYSELAYAKTIAEQFNTDHHELTVSQEHLMDELPKLIQFRDAPVAEPSDIPIYLLSVEARKSVKMVLTGEGADEFLGGYPKHSFDPYAHYYQTLPKAIRTQLENMIGTLPYRFRRAKTAIATMGIDDWQVRMPRWFGALTESERRSLTSFAENSEHLNGSPPFDVDTKNSELRKILYFDQTSWLPDNLLERGDRMTMAASLEARMPFMDYNLAGLISTLPDNCRIRCGTSKWILRECTKQLLPKEILDRPKVGFRVPVNEWFQSSMKDYLCDHILSHNSVTASYFNRSVLERYVNEHITRQQNHEKLLWAILNLEIWHKEYKISG